MGVLYFKVGFQCMVGQEKERQKVVDGIMFVDFVLIEQQAYFFQVQISFIKGKLGVYCFEVVVFGYEGKLFVGYLFMFFEVCFQECFLYIYMLVGLFGVVELYICLFVLEMELSGGEYVVQFFKWYIYCCLSFKEGVV